MYNTMKITKVLLSALMSVVMFASVTAQSKSTKPATLSNAQQVKDCSFSASSNWWQKSYDSLPSSVANNPVTGDPEFCEFYQFAEDWFLYLISPSGTEGQANWEDQQRFPLLETTGTDSCDADSPARALNVRTAKASDDSKEYVIPERIDQAGGQHAIFDQEGNIVFYEIHFSRNLCDYKNIQSKLNFPGKTLEMKMAWRIMNSGDNGSNYYQTNAIISGKEYQLGLIGWHIVVTADNHPEMVWITLDHTNNAVVCSDISASQKAYDFTSAACAKDQSQCNNLNQTLKATTIKLPDTIQPNDICQQFPYGTLEGQPIDTRDGLNIALIEKLNKELQETIFVQSDLPASLPVWKNYQFTGALWLSDITQDSGSSTGNTNQRGSLELANTVMETSFQGTHGTAGSAVNCFGCHNYNGTASKKSNTSDQASLSHIFDDIIQGQQCRDEKASAVINSQSQAQSACPTVCSSNGLKWNGQWTNQDAKTGAQLPMTVCGCCPQ